MSNCDYVEVKSNVIESIGELNQPGSTLLRTDMPEKERTKCGKLLDSFLRKRMGWMPARIALAVMVWFGFINLYLVRKNLSVAIVAMVKRNTSSGEWQAACPSKTGSMSLLNITQTNETSSWTDEDRSYQSTTLTPILQDEGEEEGEEGENELMMWDETTQGLILGSFSYGYALTQIIGGRLAELYGTKLLYGIAILSGGISALLTPIAARYHYGALIALRIVQGIFQGVTWPAMHACICRWIPPIERPSFIAITVFAATLGSAITLPLCGLIIANHGWPAAFYVTGVLPIIWCCFWFSFMYNSPSDHPRISEQELNYIQTALKESGTSENIKNSSVPWKKIFTSLPMWAILVAEFGNSWGISLFSAQLPTYMKNILGFSIKANGLLSALPFLCRYIGGILWSSLAAWLLSRKYLTIVSTRRIFGIISLWGPGAAVLGVSFAGCNWHLTMVLFCVALFCNGAGTTSGFVNHTDIAPNFSGTLMGICNTLASIIAFVVPVVTGVMTDGQQTLEAWQRVFWLCAPMYVMAEIFFLIFVSGEVQPWNNIDQQQPDSKDSQNENETQRNQVKYSSLTTNSD